MTTPIDPGNTAALAKIAYDQLWHFNNERFEERGDKDQEKYRKIADAVALAVCPPGHHVIADDDLREILPWVIEMDQNTTEARNRLWAAIGDE